MPLAFFNLSHPDVLQVALRPINKPAIHADVVDAQVYKGFVVDKRRASQAQCVAKVETYLAYMRKLRPVACVAAFASANALSQQGVLRQQRHQICLVDSGSLNELPSNIVHQVRGAARIDIT